MKTKNLKQTVTFDAKPLEIYEMLMDARKHSKIVGGKVTMSRKIEGKFNVFDGYCKGHNISLTEGEEIIQAWHFAEEGWPDEHMSICTFSLKKSGKQTKLTLTQHGIPEHKYEDLKKGWNTYYWKPMKELLKR